MSKRFNELKEKDTNYYNRQEYGKLLMKWPAELTEQEQTRIRVLQVNLNLKMKLHK